MILLSIFGEVVGGRPARLRIDLTPRSWAEIDRFLIRVAQRKGWGDKMVTRLRAVGEETCQILTGGDPYLTGSEDDGGSLNEAAQQKRRLLLVARRDGGAAELEFIASTDETNIEDQLAMLVDAGAAAPAEAETPLRLLRHYASAVRHQQYHDIDIVTIRVEVGREVIPNA